MVPVTEHTSFCVSRYLTELLRWRRTPHSTSLPPGFPFSPPHFHTHLGGTRVSLIRAAPARGEDHCELDGSSPVERVSRVFVGPKKTSRHSAAQVHLEGHMLVGSGKAHEKGPVTGAS
jgi:hypothetical protein